jgi:hypothetical protein
LPNGSQTKKRVSFLDKKQNSIKFNNSAAVVKTLETDKFWTSGSNMPGDMVWMETGDMISYTNWVGGKQSMTSGQFCIQVG